MILRASAVADRWTPVLVGVLALAASCSVLYTTPWGTGTGFDQGTYIGAARNLVAGHGLTIPWGWAAGQPVTHFPPLFPTVLAAIARLGADPWDVARYLNAALRAVIVVMGAVLAARLSRGSWIAPLLAAFLLFASVHMEFVHGSAWSEPLFLCLLFTSLWLLARHVVTQRPTYLLVSAVVCAAGLLTRYAGLALVLTAIIVLLSSPGDWPGKIRRAIVFSVVAVAPLAAWVVRNAVVAGTLVGDRQLTWQPAPPAQLAQGAFTVLDWILPSSLVLRFIALDGTISAPGALLIAAVVAALAVWAWYERTTSLPSGAAALRRVLATLCVVYPVCIVISVSAFDRLTQLDSRILSPVYISLIVLLSASAARAMRAPVAVLVVGFVVLFGVRFTLVAQRAHAEGVMYSNVLWLSSPTMRQVRDLPHNVRLFSNAPDAIYLLAGRNALEIPHAARADWLVDRIREARGNASPVILAYFDDPNIAYRNPVPVRDLQSAFAMREIARHPDGTVFEILDGQ